MTVEQVVEMYKNYKFTIYWYNSYSNDIKNRSYDEINSTKKGIVGFDYNKIRNNSVYNYTIDMIHNTCTIEYYYETDKEKFSEDFEKVE